MAALGYQHNDVDLLLLVMLLWLESVMVNCHRNDLGCICSDCGEYGEMMNYECHHLMNYDVISIIDGLPS